MRKLHLMFAGVALATGTGASALEISSNGQFALACGGAGVEERQRMKSLEPDATASLMFVTQGRGGYLADVEFTVRDHTGVAVLQGRADGPMCLLHMPTGKYRVEASYEGVRRSANLQAGPGGRRTVLAFPRDLSERISPSAQEKAQARTLSSLDDD